MGVLDLLWLFLILSSLRTLTEGRWTHDFPIDAEHAEKLGLHVATDLPAEVRDLMGPYASTRWRPPISSMTAPQLDKHVATSNADDLGVSRHPSWPFVWSAFLVTSSSTPITDPEKEV